MSMLMPRVSQKYTWLASCLTLTLNWAPDMVSSQECPYPWLQGYGSLLNYGYFFKPWTMWLCSFLFYLMMWIFLIFKSYTIVLTVHTSYYSVKTNSVLLTAFLGTILTFTIVWITVKTGDIYCWNIHKMHAHL